MKKQIGSVTMKGQSLTLLDDEVSELMKHPKWASHYIEFIELYADHIYLSRMGRTACRTCPIMKTCISLDHTHGKLRAFAHCNLHGTWKGDIDIKVTD